jgi:predicted nucleotidyltransferase component of viral defense system
MERFLYRLSQSPHADKFVLKGALMLVAWRAPFSRSTMDIDLLGRLANAVETIVAAVRDVCLQEVTPDGLDFHTESLEGMRIAEDAAHAGVRVKLRGALGSARIALQLDIGFGDIVVPAIVSTEYPTILDLPAPRIQGYSRETAIAEKFHVMTRLGILNSRMKDYYDIWLLARRFDFDGSTLATAIERTFSNRGTDIPSRPVALTDAFAEDAAKAAQWRAFLRRNRFGSEVQDLREVVQSVRAFLEPVAEALAEGRAFGDLWPAPGPWTPMMGIAGR